MKHLDQSVERGTLFSLAAVLILAISVASCGNKQSSVENANNVPAAHSGGKPVDPVTAGSVTGTIRFDGTPPKMKAINMSAVPNCAKMHTEPVMSEEVVPGNNGTLQNIVVYLKGDFSAYSFPPAGAPVKISQNGCIYSPHVAAVMTGEPVEVANADSTTHNINVISKRRQGWNETQAQGSAPIQRSFAHEEIALLVKCNIHPWMRFYLAVLSHPYFQVTDKDGQFTLRNVPPGTYTLVAWHEEFGAREQSIVIQPKQEKTVSIAFTDRDRR
jgi:plastocyanin